MEVNSYLIPELTTGTGTQPGVVVIDEPQGFGNVPLLTRQSSTTRGWPIWFITINNAPLHSTLRAAAPGAVLFTNPGAMLSKSFRSVKRFATRECAAWW